MLARGRVVRQSKLLFYAKMAEKALQVRTIKMTTTLLQPLASCNVV